MQVNSLGLTEEQPENNVQRIVLEMLGVTLSKDARARAMQLPCWNEALGLPTPWDQQWSLRIQQVLAYEIRPARVRRPLRRVRWWSSARSRELVRGGRRPSCERIARRRRLVRHDRRDEGPARAEPTPSACAASSRASCTVVGVNSFTETEPSPLADDRAARRHRHDRSRRSSASRSRRSQRGARRATTRRSTPRSTQLRAVAADRPRTSCPRRSRSREAGGTVGEWAGALREVFGEYRAPTGVGGGRGAAPAPRWRRCASWSRPIADGDRAARSGCSSASPASTATPTAPSRSRSRPATPGIEVVYQGIRLTPAEIAAAARDEDVDVVGPLDPVGLPPRPGARRPCACCAAAGVDAPVVVGGIIPDARPGAARGHGRRPGLHTEGLPAVAGSSATSPSWPGSTDDESSGGGDGRPMRRRMHDPRVIVAATGGVAALAAGAIGVAINAPALAVVAGVGGRGRRHRRRGARRPRPARARTGSEQAEDEIRAVRRELASINAVLQEEVEPQSRRRGARSDHRRPASAASRRSTRRPASTTSSTSRCSCSSRSPRRAGRCDRSRSSSSRSTPWARPTRDTRQQALGVVGDVVRRTLRESDAACRLGDLMVGAILEDTPEAGAVWAAERVRGTLLASRSATRSRSRPASRATRRTRWVRPSSCTRRAARSTKPGARGRDRVELAPEPSN